jgi:hypothetical protein
VSEIVEISPTIWRRDFSFLQGAKAANSELFKEFATQKKWKITSQMAGVILTTSLKMSGMKVYTGSLIIILLCFCLANAEANKIHNRQYQFILTIPGGMVEVTDKKDSVEGKIYYDTSAGIVMIISERESKYKSVSQYIDCGTEGLEKQMRTYFDDTGLKLIDCRKPSFYSKQTTMLHFRVSILPLGYDTYVIYFIHYKKKDIQFSFTYKYASEAKCLNYVNSLMQTLKLK